MAMTRMILVIALSIYLSMAVFALVALGNFYYTAALESGTSYEQLQYTAINDSHVSQANFLQVMSDSGNLVPYAWIATIFVLIPFMAWLVILITLFFPTGNAGA